MKKIMAVLLAIVMSMCMLTGCMRESTKVAYNIGKEADNFNVQRRLTVINARTDTVLLQLEGTFSLRNNSENELDVDKFHYELNFLPFGVHITTND